MHRILHILTQDNDTLAAEIIAHEQQQAGTTVEVVDLTTPQPDYAVLLEKIFAADSVQVW
jgi:hypothetical protein